MTPTWINLAVFWIIQIPLAWTLANRLAWGSEGVYWSVFVADMSMSLIGVYFFMKGSWKTRTV
jgi:Na+-driven multidrug efflux pump